MNRPRISSEPRVATAIRIPQSLHLELRRVAGDRDVSVNYLVIKAVNDFLSRLSPVDPDPRI